MAAIVFVSALFFVSQPENIAQRHLKPENSKMATKLHRAYRRGYQGLQAAKSVRFRYTLSIFRILPIAEFSTGVFTFALHTVEAHAKSV